MVVARMKLPCYMAAPGIEPGSRGQEPRMLTSDLRLQAYSCVQNYSTPPCDFPMISIVNKSCNIECCVNDMFRINKQESADCKELYASQVGHFFIYQYTICMLRKCCHDHFCEVQLKLSLGYPGLH